MTDRIDMMPEWFQEKRERMEHWMQKSFPDEYQLYSVYHGFRSFSSPEEIKNNGLRRPFVTWHEFYDHIRDAAAYFAGNNPAIYDKYMDFIISHFMMWYRSKATIFVTTGPGGTAFTLSAKESASGAELACGWASRYPEAIWNGFTWLSRSPEINMAVPDEAMFVYLNQRYGKPMWAELNLLWPDTNYNLNTGLTELPPELIRNVGSCI